MNSTNREEWDDLLKDVTLDDGYAHVLVQYDPGEISIPQLKETIEGAGTRVLESVDLRFNVGRYKSILFKLDAQDVRETVLNLSKFHLAKVAGYSSKV